MKALLIILIATSLTANAWLVLRSAPASAGASASVFQVVAPVTPPPAAITVGSLPLETLEMAEPAALRDQLRAAWADDTVVRSLVEAALRRRYRARLLALQVERSQVAWWRGSVPAPAGDDAKLLREMVQGPLRELMGRDPLDLRDAESRYGFVSPEKRRLLAAIALDYADLDEAAGGRSTIAQVKSELEQQRLLAEERRKDVLAALTPAERAEYDLRFEGAAGLLSGRLAVMNGTEHEFRALSPIMDEHRRQAQALSRDDSFSAAFGELQQRTIDQIAAAIGPDRALDYLWSGPGLFPELRRFTQETGLPPATTSRVLQLAAETGVNASGIHNDATIPAEQKRAALQALQDRVRPQFDTLVPEPLRARLPEQAVAWFAMLSEGRYMGFSPSLDSTGTGTIAPTAITTPAAGRAWSPSAKPRVPGR